MSNKPAKTEVVGWSDVHRAPIERWTDANSVEHEGVRLDSTLGVPAADMRAMLEEYGAL